MLIIRLTLLLLIALNCSILLAQENILKQINEEVWLPFMKTYSSLDGEGFMDIHTDDVVRVIMDGDRMLLGKEYRESQIKSNARSRERGVKRTIEFSFLERIAREEVAFEVGYYKGTYYEEGKASRNFYGKFHVLLKKVNGRWKVAIDADTSFDNSLTEADFLKGKPMDDF